MQCLEWLKESLLLNQFWTNNTTLLEIWFGSVWMNQLKTEGREISFKINLQFEINIKNQESRKINFSWPYLFWFF